MPETKCLYSRGRHRIRHLRSIVGRNITWSQNGLVSGVHHAENGVSAQAVIGNHRSIASSQSSSTTTSQTSSPSPSPIIHSTLSSSSLQLRKNKVHRVVDTLTADTLDMKRSESVSSMRSSTSTTVEDSSLTKYAYSAKKQMVDSGLLDCYLTLHGLSGSISTEPLYTSSEDTSTINPSFSLYDLLRRVSWYDAAETTILVQLWAKPAIRASSRDTGHSVKEDYTLLLEWWVDLNTLAYVGKSLRDIRTPFPPNTLLFDLDGEYYTAPIIASHLLGSQYRPSSTLESSAPDEHIGLEVESPSKMKRSYTYHHVLKISTLKECIFDTQQSAEKVQQSIQDVLKAEKDRIEWVRQLKQRQNTVRELRDQVKKYREKLAKDQSTIEDLRANICTRTQALENSREQLSSGFLYIEESEDMLEQNISMHHSISRKIDRRIKELIADLFSIYPIEQSYDDVHQFNIRDIHLSNSVYTGQNDESVSTALGFTAHLVNMLAFYLSIPLRYPITPMGSRATIRDPISIINGPRDFPLYAKGVDRYRFEFGVFLLNKNIGQLMNAYGLVVIDLRCTLPNIHYFIQAILTTSVSSGPPPLSILRIPASADCHGESCTPPPRKPDPVERSCHHLTLQPTTQDLSCPSPAPTTSTSTVTAMPTAHKLSSSPFPSSALATAVPSFLDTVTTSSCKAAHAPTLAPSSKDTSHIPREPCLYK